MKAEPASGPALSAAMSADDSVTVGGGAAARRAAGRVAGDEVAVPQEPLPE